MRETLQMSLSISNMDTHNSSLIDNLVHQKLRKSIADKIAGIATKEIQHEFHKEYRCSVIVADYDDYWRDVEEAAQKLSYKWYGPMFMEEGLK